MNGNDRLSLDDRPTGIRRMIEKLHLGETREQPIGSSLEVELTRLCASYLMYAKRGNVPLDPVARFHLANGASLDRLNWMGDTSPTGLTRSLGFTANYVYRLADVERNHEAYAKTYTIAASRQFERLARLGRRAYDLQTQPHIAS